MSTETRRESDVTTGGFGWRAGAVAGLAGAAAMTVLMLAMGATNVLGGAIPGLYGLAPPPNLPVGIGVHLFHGAVLGVVFAALVGQMGASSARAVVAAGVGYGVLTWAVLAALLMPVWLGAVGFPQAPPFPNFAVPSLLWHAVYGAVAGAVFPAVRRL